MKQLFVVFAFALLAGCGQQSSVMEEIEKSQREAEQAAAANLAASQQYLAQNKQKPGVVTTASGLQYEIVRAGDASLEPPGPADTASVMYEGRLISGVVFDSAYARGEPAQFRVGGVIAGWTEALQLMRPGAEFLLTIPPDLGYGEEGAGGDIPGNSALIFKVELLGYRTADGKTVGKF
jgi:FKBP-type peptidyl-prolyl cis-trans isomerase